MKKIIASVFVAGLVAATGCNPGATPGGKPSETKANGETVKKSMYTITGPGLTTSTSVKQGTSIKFNIGISRDSTFKDDVTVSAVEVPSGLTVSFEPKSFKGSETKEIEVTVKAADDAKVGAETFKVEGKSAGSEPAFTPVKVTVDAKDKNK